MIHLYNNYFTDAEIAEVSAYAQNIEYDQYSDCFIRNRIPRMEVPKLFDRKMRHLIKHANNEHFNFELDAPLQLERYLFAEYTEGHSCGLHQDMYSTMFFEDNVRKLSVITCLENTAIGGELVFHYSDSLTQLGYDKIVEQESHLLSKGDVIIFPSQIYHRVREVTQGRRRTLLTLVLGPKFK